MRWCQRRCRYGYRGRSRDIDIAVGKWPERWSEAEHHWGRRSLEIGVSYGTNSEIKSANLLARDHRGRIRTLEVLFVGPFAEEWRRQTRALEKKDTSRQERMRSQHRVKRVCVAVYFESKDCG